MKSLTVEYVDGKISVNFSSETSGIRSLCDRVIATAWTSAGSDVAHPSRGTRLRERLVGGAIDHTSVQHELNFACVTVIKAFRDAEPGVLGSVSMRLSGASGTMRKISTSVTDSTGASFGIIANAIL